MDSQLQQPEPEQRTTCGPLVSIALPVFNNEKTLFRAIRSIQQQTYINWELLVLDDGSTDRSCEIARSFHDQRIRIYEDRVNRGIAVRLNAAIGLARGEYFARMDGDDVSFPERLAIQVNYLISHPEVDVLGTGVVVFRGDGVALGTMLLPEKHRDICRIPWFGIRLAHPTWMGRRHWFKKNQYRTWMKKAQDQDLLLRTYTSSRFESLSEVLVGYNEEPRKFKKMLTARSYFLFSAIDVFWREKKFAYAIFVVIAQFLKSIGDFFNIIFGYKKMRNRLEALPIHLKNRWEKIWIDLNS